MTELSHDRAAEIIAAYGADAARWPDDERATALRVVAASPDLREMQTAAASLDRALVAWAQAPVAGGNPGYAAQVAMRRPRPYLRWAGGTGIAAAVAAALLLLPAQRLTPSTAPIHGAVAMKVPATAADAAAFAQVFTPTPDEEQDL